MARDPAYNACVIIPVYNHRHAIGAVVDGVLQTGLPVILVDDGSRTECAAVLDQIAAANPGPITLLRHPANGGKGRAMETGFKAAIAAGYSHAIQIDADGQHKPAEITRFAQASRAQPGTIIAGVATFDDSVPKAREYGRWITHVLVWMHCLSRDIRDSFCGLRAYPLAAVEALLQHHRPAARMDFDADIIVRLHWRGVPVANLRTPVTYPADGVSHFRMTRDNLRMGVLHIRLFCGMVLRAPILLARRLGASV